MARHAKSRRTNLSRSRGFGYVTFAAPAACLAGVLQSRHVIAEQAVEVAMARAIDRANQGDTTAAAAPAGEGKCGDGCTADESYVDDEATYVWDEEQKLWLEKSPLCS